MTINGITVGVLNCYECEFPPLYQYLAERGAQIVLGPTAADGHFRLADGTTEPRCLPGRHPPHHPCHGQRLASVRRLRQPPRLGTGPRRRLAVPGKLRHLGTRRRTPGSGHR
ncbi:hypothetical protein GCM10020254_06090 [Streptomyces goshikiensis]